jgi:hypothetical protein
VDEVQVDVVREIRRVEGIAQLAAQQAAQPTMVVGVQNFDLLRKRQPGSAHDPFPAHDPCGGSRLNDNDFYSNKQNHKPLFPQYQPLSVQTKTPDA